jgi:hypothetical protein
VQTLTASRPPDGGAKALSGTGPFFESKRPGEQSAGRGRRKTIVVVLLRLNKLIPHPEELAKQASRRMAATHRLAAILRGSQELAPQDDGGTCGYYLVMPELDPAIHPL